MPQDDKKSILENNILTESQKKEISSIIDLIVEERLKEKYNEFVKQYTKLIIESSAKHIVRRCKEVMTENIAGDIDNIKDKTNKIVKSVIVEASDKIRKNKEQCKLIIEEIQQKLPDVINKKVERKVQLLAEESIKSLEETDKIKHLFQNITKGLEAQGYTINEDIDHKVSKANKELNLMREHMEELEKKNRIYELTEGFTPIQTGKMKELLESCKTAEDVEKKFKGVKTQVLNETARYVEKKTEVMTESVSEDPLDTLIKTSSKFINPGE